jgi:hypothetical protein
MAFIPGPTFLPSIQLLLIMLGPCIAEDIIGITPETSGTTIGGTIGIIDCGGGTNGICLIPGTMVGGRGGGSIGSFFAISNTICLSL